MTPSGNYRNADFVRIGYVPGRDRFIVTFGTMLSQPEGDCTNNGYAWREYTTDMEPTGKAGLVNCFGGTGDSSGLFVGDDFYLAVAYCVTPGIGKCDAEGWQLAKYNAVTWKELVNKTYSLASGEGAGDPTVAFVNGQIDISDVYAGPGTHHNFFTTDLQFVSKRLLSDTQHNGFSSMITQGGITYFLSSRAGTAEVPWSVIVMQYDPSWTYLGMKTLREGAATPQGLAFDGNRFYVAYTERTEDPQGSSFAENVHLAAFDTSWNLVDDIALTSFTLQDQTSSIHPWLVLKDNRLYVSYSQNAPAGGIETLQAHVAVCELTQNP